MEAAGPEGYKCSLCDVICTGTDAFNAHLRGAKHLKVSVASRCLINLIKFYVEQLVVFANCLILK